MNFREWFQLDEAGHTTIRGGSMSFLAKLGNKIRFFKDITFIDPRFEFQNVPKPEGSISKAKKFLGEDTFSLPILDVRGQIQGYLVSQRLSMMSGTATFSKTPQGVVAPLDWANHALVIDASGQDLAAGATTYGVVSAQ